MNIKTLVWAVLILLFYSCGKKTKAVEKADTGIEIKFKYAQNIRMKKCEGYTRVELRDPWKKGKTLHIYYLVDKEKTRPKTNGTIIHVPLKRMVIFTTAHANLMEWLGGGKGIIGVADSKYMLIPDIQRRLKNQGENDAIADCGEAMNPNVERIIDSQADAVLLSPFDNGGGYGALEKTTIPIIECADYMETSALGRAEWMRFYGRLVGLGKEADSLFNTVEREYQRFKGIAKKDGKRGNILPERKTGTVWYIPGGRSTMGMLYRDANIDYAYANDNHSGSLALPFETILDKMGEADTWLMSFQGNMSKKLLLQEFAGYRELEAYSKGRIFGCAVDKRPYFEEVSWRPDWLLRDLIIIFHPTTKTYLGNKLRYFQPIH